MSNKIFLGSKLIGSAVTDAQLASIDNIGAIASDLATLKTNAVTAITSTDDSVTVVKTGNTVDLSVATVEGVVMQQTENTSGGFSMIEPLADYDAISIMQTSVASTDNTTILNDPASQTSFVSLNNGELKIQAFDNGADEGAAIELKDGKATYFKGSYESTWDEIGEIATLNDITVTAVRGQGLATVNTVDGVATVTVNPIEQPDIWSSTQDIALSYNRGDEVTEDIDSVVLTFDNLTNIYGGGDISGGDTVIFGNGFRGMVNSVNNTADPIEFSVVITDIPSAGVLWGQIEGTLSDQTDLQDALDEKLDNIEVAGVTGTVTDGVAAVAAGALANALKSSLGITDTVADDIVAALANYVQSVVSTEVATAAPSAETVSNIITLTPDDYTALGTATLVDESTVYITVDAEDLP